MKTKKSNISLYDKIMFPVTNILMLALVFALLQDILTPATTLEWVAVVLITGLTASPIADMNRKEMLEAIEIDEKFEIEREAHMRKSA